MGIISKEKIDCNIKRKLTVTVLWSHTYNILYIINAYTLRVWLLYMNKKYYIVFKKDNNVGIYAHKNSKKNMKQYIVDQRTFPFATAGAYEYIAYYQKNK